jgi:eukaryotic-like serine/threonine-protein kinase
MPLAEPVADEHEPRTLQERPPGAFDPSAPPPVSPGTGAPQGAAARLAPGARRYESKKVLGRGAQGEVVLCRDAHIGRDVALKRMTAKIRGDEGARARFLREARVQGQLEHPAVVPVHDLDADDEGTAFFTMKCLRGKTLAEILRARKRGEPGAEPFPQRRLLGAFASVCLAVDYAHSRGVVHRDLKPDNLMLGEYGEVYVLD